MFRLCVQVQTTSDGDLTTSTLEMMTWNNSVTGQLRCKSGNIMGFDTEHLTVIIKGAHFFLDTLNLRDWSCTCFYEKAPPLS